MVSSSPTLLLLPAPPRPSTRPALNAAYRAPLTAALTRLSPASSSAPASASNPASTPASAPVLVVAVALPILFGPHPRRKSLHWRASQSLLASLYVLVCAICHDHSIPLVDAVDVRILLIDHASHRRYQRNPDGAYDDVHSSTAVLGLASFATAVREPWGCVLHPSSEAGYDLVNAYLALLDGRQPLLHSQIVAVPGGLSLSTDSTVPLPPPASSSSPSASTLDQLDTRKYASVCLGGTFDHLHPGHKLLLHAAALLLAVPNQDTATTDGDDPKTPAVLIVGISGDELLRRKKFADELQPWHTRADRVLLFLSTIFNSPPSPSPSCPSDGEMAVTFCHGAICIRLTTLRDPFGPPIAEEDVDAIVVSGETRAGGTAINSARAERGWKPLAVYEIDILGSHVTMDDDDDDGGGGGGGGGGGAAASNELLSKISSTAIRQSIAEAKAQGTQGGRA